MALLETLKRVAALSFAPGSEAAAEARWTANNLRARQAGCPCGRPATEVRRDNRVVGSVPHESWTCNEHVDMAASTWMEDKDGNRVGFEAVWAHPQPCPSGADRGGSGPIGGPPTSFHCPHKTHDPR